MFKKRNKENKLLEKIDELNTNLMNNHIRDIALVIGDRKKMLWNNLIAGISRGIGVGIGVTIITAILVLLLQKIVTLNIPIIGEYIGDIVEIVQKSR